MFMTYTFRCKSDGQATKDIYFIKKISRILLKVFLFIALFIKSP